MLSAALPRASPRLARAFASVVDSAGCKVAAVDYGTPTSSVTFLVNAGSRYQPKAGVANALKNFAFKGTKKRSALGTVRESELYGGVLSSSLSREHLALSAEFLRGDEEYFVDVLASFLTSSNFSRHEYIEYVSPVMSEEAQSASSDPAIQALELAHAHAFRQGLGASIFAPSHNGITNEDVASYASSVFSKGNIAVLGTGIEQSALSTLVDKALAKLQTGSAATSFSPSKYFGGETRVESHGGPQTLFIGYGAAGSAPPVDLSIFSALLSPTPAVKWSDSTAYPKGAKVTPVYLPYSDAALVGLLVQAESVENAKEAGKAAVAALKTAAGAKGEEVKRGVAKAKFRAASSVDAREGLVNVLGSKVLAGSPSSSIDATLSSLDKVTASAFTKTTSALLKAKPTYIAVGDTASLPYADELGL